MGFAFALVLVVPWLSNFFELSLVGGRDPWTGVAIALVCGAVLETGWAWMKRRGME